MPKYMRCPYFKYYQKNSLFCKAAVIRTVTSIGLNYFTYDYCCDPQKWYNCPFARERRKVEEMKERDKDG